MIKKLTSLVLTLSIAVSMISVSTVNTSASVVAFFGDIVAEKLVEIGIRVAAEGMDALGEATGNETAEEAFSFVTRWLLMDASEAAVVKTQELCEEILQTLDEIEEEMISSFAVVESMLGKEAADSAKAELDNQWDTDVDGVIKNYDAEKSLELYKVYMQNALDYKNKGLTGEDLQKAVQPDFNALIISFSNMYDGTIPIEDNNAEDIKKYIFEDKNMNSKFINMISSLANNLTKENSTSIAEYAAKFAYDTYQFSHQQYEYVYTIIEKQIMQIIQVEMLYNEYLYQQGVYLKETYGADSPKYAGYLEAQSEFYFAMNKEEIGVNAKIYDMVEAEMSVDTNVSLSLNDYMKPEDSVSTTLKINDYSDNVDYTDTLYDLYYYTIGSADYVNKDTLITENIYIKEYNKFEKVMTHTTNGTQVYYIIDPTQFDDSAAMDLASFNHKIDIKMDGDIHLPSCDYTNLIKTMSDGVNNFTAPVTDLNTLNNLFKTNAFSIMGSVPNSYLNSGSKHYLPEPASKCTYLLTSDYHYGKKPTAFSTAYWYFSSVDLSEEYTGGTLSSEDVSSEIFQGDAEGHDHRYSVILENKGNTYSQTAHMQLIGGGATDAYIVSNDNNITVSADKSAAISSGEMLTIKFKLTDGTNVAKFNSLKCVRNSDAFSNNGIKTETVLLDSEDINLLTPGEDGYYTFSYPMPYSDATFILDCDPTFEISNAEEFIEFINYVNSGYNKATGNLVNDIDLTDYENEILPIGNSCIFEGTFNGNNHIISGFKMTNSQSDVGLFKNVSNATIRDFTVKGNITGISNNSIGGVIVQATNSNISNITSYIDIESDSSDTGGIVGYLRDSIIENCVNYGTINGSYRYTGGVIGYSKNSTVQKCGNNSSVYGTGNSCGGIIGSAESSTVTDCYNIGDVSGSGGICGMTSFTNITNCYNIGTITGVGNCGAISGVDGNTVINCYYLDTCGAKNKYATSKTVDQFASGEVAYLLNQKVTDGTHTWYQNIDNGEIPDDYPKFDGGTVYYSYYCGGFYIYSNSINDDNHIFSDNGFCQNCGGYQSATLSSNGVYEISNAGQLFWFASLVNGDSTHADFDEQKTDAQAILVADINLEDREWTPINSFSGTFNGNNHTISGINITSGSSEIGLFGNVSGGTIKDLTVKGKISLNSDCNKIGGVVGHMDGGIVSNVSSYVDISNSAGVPKHIGGVIGTVEKNETVIEKCTYYGSINISNSTDCFGGIVAYTNSGAKIDNCANYGTISTTKAGAYTGGILAYMNNTSASVQNSYNYGEVSNAGNTNHCGAIVGFAKNYGTDKIINNYYLGSSTSLAFGSDSKSGLSATSKTAEEFKSGNVAYLLNNEITDGTQVWYQNIDNEKIADNYPKFDGGTVYYISYKDTYSNTYTEKSEPDAFDKDENGSLIIKTYDDLVILSNLMISDYEVYGSQSYILQNNIIAPSDSEWTQGIGSVSDNKPFNGNFNGNGYCIVGLNVNSTEYGGLFELIGENGTVKDLIVFDCDFTSSSATSGGIASVNNGTIDHCISGVNLNSGTVHINSSTVIVASELNSDIKGEISGGIAGENNGLITGCRNASIVTGVQCGGIDGVNTGKIYGCANNAKVGTSSSAVCGGLAAKNGGTIESSYNSGTVKSSSENTKGSIAGLNGFSGSENPTVKNIFYITANGINSVGTDSLIMSDETNKGMSNGSKFQSADFVDQLNAVSDDTVVWVQSSDINKGYPTIKCNFLKYSKKSAGNNIYVEANMHEALNISYTTCNEGSAEYTTITSALEGKNILSMYSIVVTDNDGNYIPAELWCQDNFKITVPVDNENVRLATVDSDGQAVYYEPDSVKNDMAVFTVAKPVSFALVDNNDTQNDNSNNKTISSSSATPINTGDTAYYTVALVMLASFVFIILLRRRDSIG